MSNLVLPPDHYIVPCAYAPLPSMTDLKKIFKSGVSDIYDGRRWRKHAFAILAGEKPRDTIVWLAKPPRECLDDSEKIIVWGDQSRSEVAPNGYRPMMGQHELLDLHRAHSNLFKTRWMVALGSFTLDGDGGRRVGVLYARNGEPLLNDGWFDRFVWDGSNLFPFVSKAPAELQLAA